MAKDLRIRDEQGNLLYPVTVTDLVFDDQSGDTLDEILEGKQESLESGTNIKTINNTSLLGSGNISIPKGDKGDKGDPLTYADLTAAEKAELAQDATAAAQQAAQSLAIIQAALDNLDPSQSTDDAIVALTGQLASVKEEADDADAILKGDKIYKAYTTGGYIIHTSGKIKADNNYAYTEYIPIPASASVRAVYMFQGASGIASFASYDSSKTLIATYTANGYPNERTYTVGASAAYIRANLNINEIEECAVYVNGELVWLYTGRVPGGLIERTQDITGVDETPTKGSTNVVQSGGVFNELDALKKNVETQHTAHYKEIPIWDYFGDVSTSYINLSDNVWKTSSTSKGFLFAIKPNTKYRIQANLGASSRYALLTDDVQTTNTVPHYATGETLHSFSAGSTREFITPDDTRYIFLQYTLSGSDVVPNMLEEAVSMTDALDEIQKSNTDTILFHLKQKYFVDARVNSETFGQVLLTNGSNTSWGCSQLINVYGAEYVRYPANVKSTSNNFAGVTGTVFYDKDKVPLTEGVRLIEYASTAETNWVNDPVPTGAVYMRVCMSFSRNNDPRYYARPYKLDASDIYGLEEKVKEYDEIPLLKNARYGISESATSTAVTSDITDGTISFLHFSDIHSDRDAAKAIRGFYDKYASYISDMLSTGDVVYFDHDDDFTFYTDNNLTDALFALGNHDGHKAGNWNSLGEQATYEKYFAPYISGWNVTQPTGAAESYLMYYYKDYTPANVRLIVIDGQHQTAAQLQWFTDTLAEAKTLSYTVVVASHYVPSTFAEEGIVKKLDGDMVSFHNRASSSLSSIDTRFKLSADYADAVEDFIEDGGKFAIWLCGHYHSDYLAYASTHPNILFCAINQAGYQRGGTTGSRKIGDPCANLVTIHPRSSLIKIIRFGLKSDRYLRQINVLTYQYNSRKVFANY